MRAAVYHGRGNIRVEHVGDPAPGPDEVVLRVHATGICGTDAAEFAVGPLLYPITTRHEVTGHLGPMIPGHEIAGRVVAIGKDVTGLSDRELVVTGAGSSCGVCPWCRAGRTNLCASYSTVGLQRNGGLAQYCAVPASTCLSVEHLDITGDTAAMAQPMSIAVHSLRQGRPSPDDRVVVIGAGGIGAFLTYALVKSGVEVVAADLSAERVATAARIGASVAFQPASAATLLDELEERVSDAAVVYEVTGNPAVLSVALAAVARGGRVVAVGLQEKPVAIDARALTLREIELIGTNAHAFGRDLPTAVELLATRTDPWDDFASEAVGLAGLVDDGIVPLLERRPTQLKTLIDPWIEGTRPTQHRHQG
jgi:(R,R)-butanediol dehydrogenase/meso-butanediol dehydrogenase/diacetyl reductase